MVLRNAVNRRLSKSDRLKTRDDFTRVFRDGLSAADGTLRLLVLPNSLGRRRMGVAVSGRFRGAVRRNRVKRLCREAFRAGREELPDGYDYVLQPRAGPEHSLEALCRSLRELSRRLAGEGGS